MSDGTDGKNASTTTTRLPDIRAEVREDGTGEISIDGVVERVRMANLAEAGAAITTRIAELAGSVGQPVPVQVRDPDGVWSLLIHADGLVDEAPGALDDQPDAPDEPTPPNPSDDTAAKPAAPDGARPAAPDAASSDRPPTLPATASLTAPPTPSARRGAGTADRGRPPGGVRSGERPDTDRDPRTGGDARDDRPGAGTRARRARPGPGARTDRCPVDDAPAGTGPAAPDARRPPRRAAPRGGRRTGGARLAGRYPSAHVRRRSPRVPGATSVADASPRPPCGGRWTAPRRS